MDARRFANAQGLTMKGPRRIYDAFYSSVGMLFAQRHGFFRSYHDAVFRRFWSHDLEIDDLLAMTEVIASVGGRLGIFKPLSRDRRAPSMTASSKTRKRSVYSACPPWC